MSVVGLAGHGARAAARKLPIDIAPEADAIAGGLQNRANQTQTIIAGIVIGATLLVGFFVIDSLYDAGSVASVSDDPANSSFAADQNDTLDRIGDGMLIGGVIIIVLFAAIILRVLRGL